MKNLSESSKLIINRKRIINNLQNKIDYHNSMSQLYSQKLTSVDSDDTSSYTKFRVNSWRHKKQAKDLEFKLQKQLKILDRLNKNVVTEAVEDQTQQEDGQQPQPVQNPKTLSKMSFSSIFKPFNIMGMSIRTRNRLMVDFSNRMAKINNLSADLTKRISLNTQSKSKDQLKLKYCNLAYKLHHEFANKTIFWKSRNPLLRSANFIQLKEQYTRSLFALEQAYRREELGLEAANMEEY